MSPVVTEAWELGGPFAGGPPGEAGVVLLAALGLCAALAWLSYGYAVVALSFPRRGVLVALRTVFLGALLLCLANPVRVEKTITEPPSPPPPPSREPAGRLAVVLDRSDSMTTADNRGRTRLDHALATWRRFEPAARPVYAEVHYFSLGEDLRPAASLEEAAGRVEATRKTHLHSSIAALLQKPEDERPDAIVVLTDGIDTSNEAESLVRDAAHTAGVPVHFIAGINRERIEPFLRVREFRIPSVALRNTRFTVEALFDAFSREDRVVPFSLLQDELRIDGGTLDLKRGRNLVPWSAVVAAGEPGVRALSLQIDEGAAAQVAAIGFTSVFEKQHVAVLINQGALDWSFRTLSDALRSEPGFQLQSLVNPGLGVTLARSSADEHAITARLASDPANLAALDCIVLARLYPAHFDTAQQQALVGYVRNGGTILFSHLDPNVVQSFAGTPLAELLPVVFDEIPIEYRPMPYGKVRSKAPVTLLPFVLTDAGRASPIFASGSGDQKSHLTPKFAEHVPVWRLRPGAEALAIHPTVRDAGTGQPHILLATQAFGQGRTVLLATDGLWRWKLREPSESRAVETFWQQLMLAIARRPLERPHLRFVNMPAQVTVCEAVTVRLSGLDVGKTPILTLRAPDGRVGEFSTRAIGETEVQWFRRWKPTEPGPWVLTATLAGELPAHAFTTAVAEPTGELARTPTAVDALRTLAASTGGVLLVDRPPLAWRRENRAAKPLKLEPIEVTTRQLRWNTWGLLGLALGAYCLELVLRRAWRLL